MTTPRLYQIQYLPTNRSKKVCTKEIFATGPIHAQRMFRRIHLPLMPFEEYNRKKTYKIIEIKEIAYTWATA